MKTSLKRAIWEEISLFMDMNVMFFEETMVSVHVKTLLKIMFLKNHGVRLCGDLTKIMAPICMRTFRFSSKLCHIWCIWWEWGGKNGARCQPKWDLQAVCWQHLLWDKLVTCMCMFSIPLPLCTEGDSQTVFCRNFFGATCTFRRPPSLSRSSCIPGATLGRLVHTYSQLQVFSSRSQWKIHFSTMCNKHTHDKIKKGNYLVSNCNWMPKEPH